LPNGGKRFDVVNINEEISHVLDEMEQFLVPILELREVLFKIFGVNSRLDRETESHIRCRCGPTLGL
jgi:hypothetical protein